MDSDSSSCRPGALLQRVLHYLSVIVYIVSIWISPRPNLNIVGLFRYRYLIALIIMIVTSSRPDAKCA